MDKRVCKLCHQSKGLVCFAINKPSRGGRLLSCKDCLNERERSRARNEDGFAERRRVRMRENFKRLERKAAINKYQKEYYARPGVIEIVRKAKLAYRGGPENIERQRVSSHNRRAAERSAKSVRTEELDRLAFSEAARLVKMRERMIGGRWHVDHIEPLRGRNVCGLHNAFNLAVVPALYNLRKNAKQVDKRWFMEGIQ